MFSIDFHTHSNYSADSLMKVKKMIAVAKGKGLNGIAITDHNVLKGCLDGSKLVPSQDFIVVCGSEIDSDQGHIIGLFLNEEIRATYALEIIDEIKDQGGISILAHPFKQKRIFNEELLNKVDCIEVFNSRMSLHDNLKAYRIAEKLACPMIAGSDAHFYSEIGNAITLVNCDILEAEELKKAIIKKEVKMFGCLSSSFYNLGSNAIKELRMKVSGRILKFLLENGYALFVLGV
jgi:hypothetical protein